MIRPGLHLCTSAIPRSMAEPIRHPLAALGYGDDYAWSRILSERDVLAAILQPRCVSTRQPTILSTLRKA